jgi:hypothetical protein
MAKEVLTSLTNEEAKKLLAKFESIIYRESVNRSHLAGMSSVDLMQECRIRILQGYKTFDPDRGSERNWGISVIKKTLNGIWKQQLRNKRVPKIMNSDGEIVPIRHLSFRINTDKTVNDGEFSGQLSECSYSGKNCPEITRFGTTNFSQDEYVDLINKLKLMKENLPEEAYSVIKEELFSKIEDLEREIKSGNKDSASPANKARPLEDFEIYSVVANPNSRIKDVRDVQIMSLIAEFFIRVLKFNKDQILNRTYTADILLPKSMR